MPKHEVFFFSGLFFLFGVLLQSLGISLLVITAIVLLAGSVGYLFYFLKPSLFCAVLVPLSLFVFVGFGYSAYRDYEFSKLLISSGTWINLAGTIISDPYIKGGVHVFSVKTIEERSRMVRVAARSNEVFAYGDTVRLHGKAVEPVSEGFKRYFRKEGVHANLAFPRVTKTATLSAFSFRVQLFRFKRAVISVLKEALPLSEAALSAGLLFGDKTGFTEEFELAVRESGTSHAVALSGFNVSILMNGLFWVMLIFFRRRTAFISLLPLLVLFTLMVGTSASLVRAIIMTLLILLAREFGRVRSMRNIFMLSAVLMVIYEPAVLLNDLGFQLSFLALAGIVYVQPFLPVLFQAGRFVKYVWSVFTTTFAAQLMVSPLLIFYFSSFPIVGFVANILIVPLIPAAMLFSFLSFIAYHVFPFALPIVAAISSWLLGFLVFIIHQTARVNPELSLWALWCVAGFLFVAVSLFFLVPVHDEAD